jgi:hypothetical protein
MNISDYIQAARVPDALEPQSFGLWSIRRKDVSNVIPVFKSWIGFESMTLLHRFTMATMHTSHGEVVMEDSTRELRRHLPIWLRAKGRVLVTGLGLGCVVRGLLASENVEHVTVIEIDAEILRIVGKEFESDPRVRLIHGDALTVTIRDKFDYAWHDIWTEGNEHLQVLHAKLIKRFYPQSTIQGAWNFPRQLKRLSPEWVLR